MSSSSSAASARLPIAGALVAGVAAAAGTALLSSYLSFALIVAAAIGVLAVVLVIADPFKAMLVMLMLRASVEGVRTVVLVRVLNVDIAPPDVINLIFLAGAVVWSARHLVGP